MHVSGPKGSHPKIHEQTRFPRRKGHCRNELHPWYACALMCVDMCVLMCVLIFVNVNVHVNVCVNVCVNV